VFYGATEISKTDFFDMFPRFSGPTFTEKLCKSAFRKTGLIPFDLNIVLNKMKEYGGIQEAPRIELSDNESDGFATPPLILWDRFNTPITNTGRQKGQAYVTERLRKGDITPTVLHVQDKIVKASDRIVSTGQLSTEYLLATQAREQAHKERNEQQNKIVQKYGEIYGHQARRQITEDEEERQVINMRE
jgi:hypothetical protein